MNLKHKWGAFAGAALISGALLTGVAFAAGDSPSAKADVPKANILQKKVEQGKLTQGQADVLKQLWELRRSYMEKFRADAKAVLDQAVKDGKITQEQADKMLKKGGRFWPGHHGKGKFHGMGRFKGMSEEQVKAKLDEAVKSGKLTQQQADRILELWRNHQNKARQQ